jgi:hypothetical protein
MYDTPGTAGRPDIQLIVFAIKKKTQFIVRQNNHLTISQNLSGIRMATSQTFGVIMRRSGTVINVTGQMAQNGTLAISVPYHSFFLKAQTEQKKKT